ncbi:hypothetical protein FRC02_008828 [Tulasnella sp. 418]|nr:hypothetical protein FRC02_008828 [Tulasnella sp. 418]
MSASHQSQPTSARSKYSKEQLAAYWDEFNIFDIDHDGKISLDELATVMREQCGEPCPDLEAVIHEFDQDGDGRINFDEYLCMMSRLPKKPMKSDPNEASDDEAELKDAFRQFDANGDGYITKAEFFAKLGRQVRTSDIDDLVAVADTNGDGMIDYQGTQFLSLIDLILIRPTLPLSPENHRIRPNVPICLICSTRYMTIMHVLPTSRSC